MGWLEALDLPIGEGDAAVALLAIVALVLIVVFAGPFLWIVALFLVEMLLWIMLAVAGLAAWLVFGRPWQVAVIDDNGVTLAIVAVRSRRRAREHAAVVRQRLATGATPTAAVTSP